MDVGYGPAPHEPPPGATAFEDHTPNWYVRGAVGFGSVAKSDQRELLELNGYDEPGVRWQYKVDAAGFPWSHLGLGVFMGYSRRTVDPDHGGPPLEEDVYRLGGQLVLTTGTTAYKFLGVPRLGLVHGRQSLHDRGSFVTGPMFGADVGMVFPKIHIGFSIGGYYAPVPASGDLGERDDFGGVELLFTVYFDG